MPVTKLDQKTALVVIDLQKGLVSYPTIHSISDIAGKARLLAAAFRANGLPVVLVNVTGRAPGRTEQPRPAQEPPADWAELLPELDPKDSDIRISKRTWGAFPHTDLEGRLKDAAITQVVICGVATSIGVESTAREAYAMGLNVTLATDAMTDMDKGAHENSLVKIFPKLGETGTVEAIVELIGRR